MHFCRGFFGGWGELGNSFNTRVGRRFERIFQVQWDILFLRRLHDDDDDPVGWLDDGYPVVGIGAIVVAIGASVGKQIAYIWRVVVWGIVVVGRRMEQQLYWASKKEDDDDAGPIRTLY
jgi:hypothetical protein